MTRNSSREMELDEVSLGDLATSISLELKI